MVGGEGMREFLLSYLSFTETLRCRGCGFFLLGLASVLRSEYGKYYTSYLFDLLLYN